MVKPTLAQLRSGLHFSASALKTYLQCPWKFKLHYVEGVQPEFRPSGMVLGGAVHQALAQYHLAVMGKESFDADQLMKAFDDVLDRALDQAVPVQFKKGEDPEALGGTGRGLLEVYHREARFTHIVDVERPFRASLADPRTGEVLEPELVGVFDLIEADDEGTVSVVEIKTAARRWSEGQVNLDLQGSLYAEAVSQLDLVGQGEEALIRYEILVKNKKPILDRRYAVRREGDRHMAMTIAADALRAIEHDAFYRNPGWGCSGCQYRKQCGI